jgi:hypothetical protein
LAGIRRNGMLRMRPFDVRYADPKDDPRLRAKAR